MAFRLSRQPDDEHEFEHFCARLLRAVWQRPHLKPFGKRGERQDGVDLFDPSGTAPVVGVQCKHHEPHKTIPYTDIEAEVRKADGFVPRLAEYFVLTTARKSADLERKLAELNLQRAAAGRFPVLLWTWPDIEAALCDLDDFTQDRITHGGTGRSAVALRAAVVSAVTTGLDATGYANETQIDLEIEAAKTAADEHRLEVADDQLAVIERRYEGRLTPPQRYRVAAQRANILVARGEWDRAGRLLLDAARLTPGAERARTNRALGYELTGDAAAAHREADALRADYPNSARLLAIWVRTAPAAVGIAAAEVAARPLLGGEGELELALGHRALEAGEYEVAIRYARSAADLDPDAPQCWFVLGAALHETGRRLRPSADRAARLREADDCYAKAARLARVQHRAEVEAVARVNRGILLDLLDDSRAEGEFAAAADLRPDTFGYRLKYAAFLTEAGEFDRALQLLADPPAGADDDGEVSALVGWTRYRRDRRGDGEATVEVLRRLIDRAPTRFHPEAAAGLVEMYLAGGHAADALALVDRLDSEVYPLLRPLLRARVHQHRGETEAGLTAARAAAGQVTPAAAPELVRRLAALLARLGDDEAALPLLEQVAAPGVLDDDTRALLNCALRLQRHDVALRVCEALREAGQSDPTLLSIEVEIRQAYDPEAAFAVAKGYSDGHPDDRFARLWVSVLALRLGRREDVLADPARLPAAAKIDPQHARLVIHVLAEAGSPLDAIRFAYQVLRANFDHEAAHGVYLAYFHRLATAAGLPAAHERVGPGSAVCFTEPGSDQAQWVVIEEEAEPKAELKEVGPAHPVAAALIGRHVGDTVGLTPDAVQDRRVVIREIVSKYVHRFQTGMAGFQLQFPGSSACQVINLGSGPDLDLSDIILFHEERAAAVRRLEEVYRAQPVPLYMMAERFGATEFDVIEYLGRAGGPGVACFQGGPAQLAQALAAEREAGRVVIDLTALHALGRLGLSRLLPTLPAKPIVSRSTYERLLGMIDRLEDGADQTRYVSAVERGQLVMLEDPPDTREQRRAALDGLRQAVESACEIRPCPELAAVSPAKRDLLLEVVGRHNAESFVLAAAAGAALWTDDGVLGMIGAADFGVRRVWTQVVLHRRVQAGSLTDNEYDRAVASLVGWSYQGIQWNAVTALAAADLAEWDLARWPVPQVLRHLRDAGLARLDALRIASQAIVSLWRRDLSLFHRQAFVFAVCTGLQSGNVVRRLARLVPAAFGLDQEAAGVVTDCITVWLRHPTGLMTP
jgi:tetratricopeptide (TPR) repeat protein